MVTATLEAFLRTARLGPLHLGMTQPEVVDLAGPAEAVGVGSRRHPRSGLWKYGDVQLSFAPAPAPRSSPDARTQPARLCLIFLERFQSPHGAGRLLLAPGGIQGGMARAALEEYLRTCALAFQPIPSPDDQYTWLQVEAGVTLILRDTAEPFAPPPGLFALFFSSREPSLP
jgi:hypothetical protein